MVPPYNSKVMEQIKEIIYELDVYRCRDLVIGELYIVDKYVNVFNEELDAPGRPAGAHGISCKPLMYIGLVNRQPEYNVESITGEQTFIELDRFLWANKTYSIKRYKGSPASMYKHDDKAAIQLLKKWDDLRDKLFDV